MTTPTTLPHPLITGDLVTARHRLYGTELPQPGMIAGAGPSNTGAYPVWFYELGAPALGTTVHTIHRTNITPPTPAEVSRWNSLDYRDRMGFLAATAATDPTPHPRSLAPGLAKMLVKGIHPQFPHTRTTQRGSGWVTLQLDSAALTETLVPEPGYSTSEPCYRLDPNTLDTPDGHQPGRCHGSDIRRAIALGWQAMNEPENPGMIITCHWPTGPRGSTLVGRFIAAD